MKKILLLLVSLLILPVYSQQQEAHTMKSFMDNAVLPNEIPYGNNASAGHYTNAGDAKIYYEVYGKGKPLVILHGGIAGSTYEMRQLIDDFSKYYQVIAISTRGHGKSELGTKPHTYEQKAKDVVAVLNEVTKDSVTVFGFSDGGYTGYYLASLFPQKVKQMVVIGAAETHPGDYKINLKVADMMQLDKAYWEQQLQLMPEPNRLQEMFDKVSDATAKMLVSKDFFATIKCPVLVMAGNHDQFVSTQRVVNASKMLPNAELAIIPNATHAAFLENFPAVWSVTSRFLKLPTTTIVLASQTNIAALEYADPTKVMEDGKAPGLKFKLLSTVGNTKTYILIFAKGDEVVSGLTEFAKKHNIKSGHYTGLGDMLTAKAGWFDYQRKQFRIIPIDTAEVTSFTGDIAWYKGKPVAHTHMSAALQDGSVKGGHLLELFSGPTMEIILVEEPKYLYKKLDSEFKAALIDPESKDAN